MLPSRSELMYFTLGVAVGGVVGANWSKVKPLLESFMGPAAEGFRDAYADMARKFAEQAEAKADAAADEQHRASRGKSKKGKRNKKSKSEQAPMTAADLVQAFMFN